MRSLNLAAIVAWCGILNGWTFAEDSTIGGAKSQAETTGSEAQPALTKFSDSPMSIFNEEVRRFRFHMEHTLVTNQVAAAFMAYYSRPENPEIIGAYADTAANTLLVVGPPVAESAIRKSLATWIVETAGIDNPSLEVQKRRLLDERKTWLEEMANVEIGVVDAAERKGEQAVKELQTRLDVFEKELQITERKIEVVNKYIKRLDEIQK